MIRILFVCHGNICRSPMAEFVMKDLVNKAGQTDRYLIASAATSTEEIGNPIHPGTRRKLIENGIPEAMFKEKHAIQLQKEDYDRYDYLIGMDRHNIGNMLRIVRSDPKGKVLCLLDFTDRQGDIADPWYTGDFEATYQDVLRGCLALLYRTGRE